MVIMHLVRGGVGTVERRAAIVGLSASFLLLALGAMPHVLVGVLAAPMQADIGFSPEGLGVAIAVFWAFLTVTGPLVGPRIDRWGWARGAIIGASVGAASLIVLGWLTFTYPVLLIGLAIGGAGLAICSPASNLAIVQDVPHRFQGQAFGIKQSAMPAVALIAGLSVPLIAVTVGWRWVFILCLVIVPVLVVLATPSLRRATNPETTGHRQPSASQHQIVVGDQQESVHSPALPAPRHTAPFVPLKQLAIILGLGTMTLASLSTFGVLTMVDSGISLSVSGLIIAAASAFALFSRIAAGWWIDRRDRVSLRPIGVMIAVSIVGIALLSTGQEHLIVLGIVIALSAGWGWPPILILFTVRSHAHAPAGSTGVTSVGSGLGSMTGPLIFGAIAGSIGFSAAWWFTAGIALMSVILIFVVQHHAEQRERSAEHTNQRHH